LNAAAKIRWLLALICVSLFLTAIVARKTYSPGKTLETHLNQKEQYVAALIKDKASFIRLKNIANDEDYALQLVNIAKNEKVYIATYNQGQITYWNGVRVLPDNQASIREGSSFIKEGNGYYEAIKKTEGDFSVVFFIPIKNNYAYQNAYLKNIFSPDLLQDDNITLGNITGKNGYDIYTYDHHYLFTVKLVANELNHFFAYIQILLWLSGLLLLCALTNNLAERVAKKGYIFTSFSTIALFIVTLRFVNLHYHWPDIYDQLSLFDPIYYASGTMLPSLGDFVINVLLATWLAVFIYNHRSLIITKPVHSKLWSYLICTGVILFLIVLSTGLLNLFKTLIYNSKINFDVNNVLNLTGFSVIGVLALCFGFLIFILFTEACLSITLKLNVPVLNKLIIFLALIVLATFFEITYHDFSDFYLLWSLLVIIRGYAVFYDEGKYSALTYIGIIIICSSVSSVKLYVFESIKEKQTREILTQKLESANDITAEYLFKQIESEISGDSVVINYFKDPSRNHSYLRNRFQKLYFDGYLSKYDFTTYEYDGKDQPFAGSNTFDLSDFKGMVMYSAIKVGRTTYFYQPNNSFGFQSYFAIIPIRSGSLYLGSLVINLKSKPFKSIEPFPELLTENSLNENDEFKGYSYAFYSDGLLLNQSGKYIYSLANYEFGGKLKKYIYKTTVGDGTENNKTKYSHLIYQPSERKVIVITKEDDMFYSGITSLTFFFLVFLIFSLLLLGSIYIWKNYESIIKFKSIKWAFWQNFDKVLYKTRIQLSMVFAVVTTLLIIGILTFVSVKNQYLSQQDQLIHDKMARIAIAFEQLKLTDKFTKTSVEEEQIDFNQFASTYSADLTFFDKDGQELLTTQPKLYETGLIERRMDARAFIYLKRLEKSGFINPELIGTLDYKAAYAPIRNSKNSIIGFLQLPYFANETEYRERIGSFLNTMINVYALVFVAIGLFAIAVARQITTPLTLIQQSLSNTIYGRKNEPIQWEHNDEIGSLIKEYNKMIAALENSAQKLAQSERENAWREMAKQVAHEIKNPLTPLKLGLQLLEKAWRDKDPRFDQKFERFSKSFVEQIDSLSRIASEFSNFAKMPETQMERFNIFDAITQATTIFRQTDNFEIKYIPSAHPFFIHADKDQILRSFNNLLKNAIEAMPAERHGIIEIIHTATKTNIQIQIKDNGSGIPEALRERIFVPNFTTKNSGTGLGLALVKNAIEYAGGTISFDTEPDKGTTFYIRFQAAT
jgi:two-component system nitrogen regulation sensor histidine kinase NtrY